MKILEFDNRSLSRLITASAVIKSPVSNGTAMDIAVDDNTGFADNDVVLVGELGKARTEIFQVNTTVTPGTAIQADSLLFPHNAGTPLAKIPYNQVRFYHAATLAGTKSIIGSAADLAVDSDVTVITDSTNTTGYLFFALYNSITDTESSFSGGFSYGALSMGVRSKIRDFVKSKHNWDRELDEATFTMLCDAAEAEIFAIRRWRFREKMVTFNSVAAQQAYTLSEAGATDLGQLIYATYDGNPVIPADIKTHKNLNWNVLTQGTPLRIWEWDGSLYFTPIPSEVKAIVLYYYKNSIGFTDDTSETGVQLPMAIAYRVLQDLWAMIEPRKSEYFERRYLQAISAMKINDLKQVSKFPSLADSTLDSVSVDSQVNNPRIT